MNFTQYTYLDHNATSYLRPEIAQTMQEIMALPLNASSVHRMGQYGKNFLQKARQNLADFIECNAEEIIFTGGGTEGNNTALAAQKWDHILVSETEHDSIAHSNPTVQFLSVTQQGIINLAALEKKLQQLSLTGASILVSVQYANNETGILQPLDEIVKICHQYDAIIHSDTVQAFGKIPFSFRHLDVDMITLSAHKVGGPQGVGALIVKKSLPFLSFIKGGGQEKNRRAGTENVAAIAGLGTLPNLIDFDHYHTLQKWHRHLESELKTMKTAQGCSAVVIGEASPRLPNTTCISMPHIASSTQLVHFDLQGFAINTGAACSSGTLKPSRILQSMGISDSIYKNTIRLSSGWNTKEEDLIKFSTAWKNLFFTHHLQKESA